MNQAMESSAGLTPARAILALSSNRRWWIVGLLFTASLINYLDRATISMALPLIGTDLHLGPETKGVLLSAFFWSYAAMQIPIGWCADRFNLRWLYAAAFALWSLAQGLTGIAGSFAMLIVFRIVLGIGESIYLPGGTKVVSLLFGPADRGLPSGLFDFGTRTGLVLEGLLIPWLLMHYGWRLTFMVVGFAALLWLGPWLAVTPARLKAEGEASPGGSKGPAAAPSGARPSRSGWREIVSSRNLLGICIGFFCFDYYWYLLVTWLPDYLVNARHLTILKAGIYTALPFFIFGITEPLGGWIADRLIKSGWDETRTRKGIVAIAFATGFFLLPAMRAATPRTTLAMVMGGCLVGLATGNLIVILQCCAPPEKVGVWTGVENFAGNLAGIVAPFATGALIARTGSYTPGFALGPAVLVVGLAAYWLIVGKLEPKTT